MSIFNQNAALVEISTENPLGELDCNNPILLIYISASQQGRAVNLKKVLNVTYNLTNLDMVKIDFPSGTGLICLNF